MNFEAFAEKLRDVHIFGVTVIALTVAAAYQGFVSFEQIGVIVLTTCTQLFLVEYWSIYGKCAPLDIVDQNEPFPNLVRMEILALCLGLNPLLAIFSVAAAALVCGSVLLAYFPRLLTIARRVINRKALGQRAIEVLERERYPVAFYVAGLDDVAYQINQWIPVAERLPQKCCIIVRRLVHAHGIVPTKLTIFRAQAPQEVERVLNSGVRVVLYPGNGQENAVVFRHYEIQHFFINHGESDKIVNQSKLLMAYDKLLVAGPLAERRMRKAGLKLREGQVEYVGRPQTELFLNPRTAKVPIRTILYAPTWEGFVEKANYSSLPLFGAELLRELAKNTDYQVIVKPHPLSGHRLEAARLAQLEVAAICEGNPRFRFVAGKIPIYELMNECDVMIADIGSVVNDFLATRKPIVVCNSKKLEIAELQREFPTCNAAYIISGAGEIAGMLREIDGLDPLEAQRDGVRRDSLGDSRESSLARFQAVLDRALGEPVENVAAAG